MNDLHDEFIELYDLNSKESLEIMDELINESKGHSPIGEELLTEVVANYIACYSELLFNNAKSHVKQTDESLKWLRNLYPEVLTENSIIIKEFIVEKFELKAVA